MTIPVKTSQGTYNIYLKRGALQKVGQYLSLNRRVLIVTDDGVPPEYSKTVANYCKKSTVLTIPQGENSKQMDIYSLVLETLVKNNFTRTDCVVAVGGGVVGDLCGFAASTYMRGIDFYNIPTTMLSQVDSSIGGKTAIDFMGLKNIVGAFYPPKAVIIDPDTLKTLPPRQLSNGLAESLKMSLTSDPKLFSLFEQGGVGDPDTIDKIIYRSLLIKKHIVELDEHEAGLRKVLNFGHTLGHAVESMYDMETYYHGECVAIGMVPMCASTVQQRLLPVLDKLGLPHQLAGKSDVLLEACRHDKKMTGDHITVVYVPAIGEFQLKTVAFTELETLIRQVTLV